MAVYSPCYSTRDEVKRALDVKQTSRTDLQIDRAIEGARDDVNGLCHRRFYNIDETRYFDYPSFQRTYPWKIYLDQSELADVTANVPVVKSGTVTIPADDLMWGPWNDSPPFTRVEINRSTSAAFGLGNTPQKDVSIQGTFGYWVRTSPAGTLAAAISDTTSTSVTVSDGALVGVGDVLIAGSERMIVSDQRMVSTGVSFGALTASVADVTVAVADGTVFDINEELLLDAERMLITDIAGNTLLVKRAWDGTVLSAHTSGTIYANRGLTVIRGSLGTTAATHLINASLVKNLVPAEVKNLSTAEAINTLLGEQSGYSRAVGTEGGSSVPPGASLPDLRKRVFARYGRKARTRVV